MNESQIHFLKSCFRLPGLSPEIALSGRKFLDSEAFVFFVLKQIEQLSLPGLSFAPKKYLLIGKWGFTASVSINGREKLLMVALREEDNFKDALKKLMAAVNNLTITERQSLPPEKQSPIKKLLDVFAYQPAPLSLRLIDTGTDHYIGYLPETISIDVKLADIEQRDLIRHAPFPFPAFSYQPEQKRPLAQAVNARESADPRLLSGFTGLDISNQGGWHVMRGDGKANLNCTDHYKDVIEAINLLTKKTGARLYLQPYPWSIELLFFITRDEEKRYADFLFHPNDDQTYLAKNKKLILSLTEAYVDANPSDTEALGELTTCYGNLKDHKKTLALIEQCLPLAPDNFVLRNNKLIALVHLHRYEEAIEAGMEALKINTHSWNTCYFLGVSYTHLEQYDDAFSNLQFCVKEAPDQPFHWFALGFVFYKTNDYDKAIENYTLAIKTSERYGIKESVKSSSWYNMACLYSLQNKIEEAKNAFIEALRLDHTNKNSLFKDEELENLRQAVDADVLYKAAGV
jgi:tetratricopeptide (TPR) repeat protein